MTTTVKILVAVLVVVTAGILWRSYSLPSTPKGAVKIGVILPLSGDFGALGEEARRGIELAVDEARKDSLEIQVIYEDDQSILPQVLARVANKLVSVDKVNAAITLVIEEVKPIAPIFNNGRTPLLAIWDSNAFIRDGGDYIFSNGFSTEKAGARIAEYAYQKLNLRRAAMLGHVDPAVDLLLESFENTFESLGGSIVYNQKIQVSNDYKTQIIGIKQAKPDAVYAALLPPSSIAFYRQARDLGLNTSLLATDATIQDVIDGAAGAAEGTYFTNIYADNEAEVSNLYRQKHGADSIAPTIMAISYNTAKKMMEVVKENGGSQEEIKNGLRELLGETRSADQIERVFRVVNGKPERVE